MSSALNFCFLYTLLQPPPPPPKKKDHIRWKINSKKKNISMWNQYYFDMPKIRVGQARTTKNQVAFT